ncbi:hypothetical protein P691DRAFT_768534, partial [Macrolepiota fuliginosa MF-IS2]
MLLTIKQMECDQDGLAEALPVCVGSPLGIHSYLSMIGLYFEPRYKFLVCPDCGIALTSNSAPAHVRTNHPACKTSVNNAIFAKTCKELGIVATLPTINAIVDAITGLKLYPDALQCAAGSCDKVYGSVGSMKQHHRNHHHDVPLPRSWPSTPAQRLDNALHSTLFPVIVPPNPSAPPSLAWLNALDTTNAKAIKSDPLAVSDPRDLNQWLRSTNWATHVQGYDVDFLRSLVAYPADKEFPWLREAVVQKFIADAQLIEKTPLLALQKLNTENPAKTGISNQPFRVHQNGAQTLTKYCVEPTSLIAFLLRDPVDYKLPLCSRTLEAIKKLKSLPRSSPVQDYMDCIQKLLFTVFSTSWTPTDQNSLGDPVHCYLALSSIKRDHRWADPKDVTGPLAKLTYVLRLVVLREAHKSPDVSAAIDSLSSMYTEKVESPFNTIRTLQHLASDIAYTTVGMPAVFWKDDDFQEAVFRGGSIKMSQVRGMARSLLFATYNLMVDKVFLGYHFMAPAERVVDDLTDDTPGGCFLDNPSNSFLEKYHHSLIQTILRDPALSRQFILGFHPNSGEPLWNIPRLRLWYRHFCDLQLHLAALVELLAGAPARGTELTCLQYRNTPSQLRGFYKMHNRWVIICRYNKTSANTGHEKLIPHPVDPFTGSMFFHSLIFG